MTMTKKKTVAESKKSKNPEKEVQKIAKDLFKKIGMDVKFTVNEDKDNEAILLNIETEEEAGLIIGNRGRNLSAIQLVLGMIYRQRSGDWQRILVNVSDWREKEEERLKGLAQATASRVVETGEPQTLYNLTPSQRRIVHMVLAEEKDIITESQGEGDSRYLVVSPKK
jgi:spoIIIJ-associated protein